MKIASSSFGGKTRLQDRSAFADLFQTALLLDDDQRAQFVARKQKRRVSQRGDRKVFRTDPAAFAGFGFHAEQAAATDLLQRAPQLRLKDDRQRDRGTEDDELEDRRHQHHVQDVCDAEQADQHEDAGENLHRARSANEQKEIVDRDAGCEHVEHVGKADRLKEADHAIPIRSSNVSRTRLDAISGVWSPSAAI